MPAQFPGGGTGGVSQATFDAHVAGSTNVHGIPDAALLVVTSDARLSDERTPTTASVTAAKVNGALKPSGSAVAGTEALRALGTGSTQAAAGDDGRFPTSGQKNALAGTSGTPGTPNPYVTEQDARNTNPRTPTAHTHPESEVTNLVADLAGKQPLDSDLTNIAALSTTPFGRGLLELANQGALLTAAGAAASSHTHAEADITGLVADLAAKASLPAAYSAVILADSPALYWRLGETSGTTAADASPNSRTGTYSGGFTLAQTGALTGDANTAVLLNGSTGRVISTYQPFATGSVRTFECWAKRNSRGTIDAFFGSDASAGPALFDIGGGVNISWRPNAGSSTGQADWVGAWPGNLAQWVHVVLVVDLVALKVELYINGVSQGAITTTNYTQFTDNFWAGGYASAGSGPFDGSMDEVAIYTSALTAHQVRAHYHAGLRVP